VKTKKRSVKTKNRTETGLCTHTDPFLFRKNPFHIIQQQSLLHISLIILLLQY